jgi:hypothetical protein
MRPLRRNLLTTPAKRQYNSGPSKKRVSSLKCFLTLPSLEAKFDANQPVRLKNLFKDVPAYEKWFIRDTIFPEISRQEMARLERSKKIYKYKKPVTLDAVAKLNMEYLGNFGDTVVPLELTKTSPQNEVTFERFEGPLSLLFSYMATKPSRAPQMYLAQHSLADLPAALQADLPTPEILKLLGRGDVYGSSLWMGRAPTCTPLHRDPNPNLFVQLSGKKTIRLLRPDVGNTMYEKARALVRDKTGRAEGMANMRGVEMMQGEERRILEKMVWNDGAFNGAEVTLKKGDGCYIPLGWWHAVRGTGVGPNVSVSHLGITITRCADRVLQVNWWFR